MFFYFCKFYFQVFQLKLQMIVKNVVKNLNLGLRLKVRLAEVHIDTMRKSNPSSWNALFVVKASVASISDLRRIALPM